MASSEKRNPWVVALIAGLLVGMAVLLILFGAAAPLVRSVWTGKDEGLQDELLNEIAMWLALGVSAAAAAGFTYWRCRVRSISPDVAAMFGLLTVAIGTALVYGLGIAIILISCGVGGPCSS